MTKTYEQRMAAYRSTCINHARLETLQAKFQIASEKAEGAAVFAARAARWAFTAYPDLRENVA